MTVDWSSLVQQHGRLVWRTAHRLLQHDADAADCFQQAFVAALELHARQPVRHWPAVFVCLTTRRALHILRQRKRPAELTDTPDDAAADPLAAAARGELVDRLRRALGEIDPVQAEVFCLVCLDGQTNQQAADAVGVTAAHAGMLLHRARKALQERLAAFDPRREVRQ